MRGRLKKDPVGDAKLTVYATEPTPMHGQDLEGHLVRAGVGDDQEILALARALLTAAGPAALAPGSVAANVIKQVNKNGGTGFIGGQHVHQHGTPTEANVSWELFRLEGDGYELRNIGTITADDVAITANVELAWPTPPDREIPRGSSVMFICSPSPADASPRLTVTYSALGAPGRQRWQRPLPGR